MGGVFRSYRGCQGPLRCVRTIRPYNCKTNSNAPDRRRGRERQRERKNKGRGSRDSASD